MMLTLRVRFAVVVFALTVSLSAQTTPQQTPPTSQQDQPTSVPAGTAVQQQSQQTTADPTPVGDQEKLSKLSQEFGTKQAKYQQDVDTLTSRVKTLQDQISSLTPAAKTIKDLKDLIQKASARLTALEELSAKQAEKRLNADEVQYRTAFQVLQLTRQNMLKLNFTVQLSSDINNFQQLTNPAKNPTFIAAVSDVKQRIGGRNEQLTLGKAALANPYISVAWSIGSLLVSKLGAGEKLQKFNNVICLVDAATVADTPTRILSDRLAQLSTSISTFNIHADELFRPFVASVGYTKTRAEYETEQDIGREPLDPHIIAFFNPSGDGNVVLSAKNADAASSAKFQVEKVKQLLVEYDNVLRQMDEFLNTFQATVTVYKTNLKFDCSNMDQIKLAFDALERQAATLPASFKNAYGKDVPPQSRRILYGIN